MRSDDAKRLPLDRILADLGYQPVKSRKNGNELWYKSPFRQENTASLHITRVHHARLGWIWVWKDFGDIGGNVLDFAMRYYRISDIAECLRKLDGLNPGAGRTVFPSPAPPAARLATEQKAAEHPFTDVRIQPLASPHLLEYLAGRGIPADLAKRYLQQVEYQFDGMPFSAIAFANDQGGYEMRSTGRFKGALPPKTITLLHPEKLASGGAVTVFEGFMDYLSALVWYGREKADTPVLVLNSAVMENAAIEKIQSLGVRKLHLYSDRDTTGKQLVEHFRERLPEVEITDHSRLYAGYKDFSAFLMAKRRARGR